jgi:dihydrofolate reductase
MVAINIIAAISRRGGIGLNNKIPWDLKGDMSNFKRLTIGNGNNSVIMGRKTWESLNGCPLKNRKNIVISSILKNIDNNIKVVNSLGEAIEYSNKKKYTTTWIAGGSRIYDEALSVYKVSGLYLTRVDTGAVCDTFFPHFNDSFSINKLGEWETEHNMKYRYEYYISKALSTQIFSKDIC